MPKESVAELKIREWLERRGLDVQKGAHVDIEARSDLRLVWAIEVKGDQENDRALRNSFLTGLGQLSVARARHAKTVTISYGLSAMYRPLVSRYRDVLDHHEIGVVWVDSRGVRFEDGRGATSPDRNRRGKGHGHPDGSFLCGPVSFTVRGGKIASVAIGKKQLSGIQSFSTLCEVLGLEVGANSAARVLARNSEPL